MPKPITVYGRREKDSRKNVLEVKSAALRTVVICMRVPKRKINLRAEIPWRMTGAAVVEGRDWGDNGEEDVLFTVPPCELVIPPLGAQAQVVALCCFPFSVDRAVFEFWTEDKPDARAEVWAWPDRVASPAVGLFLLPFPFQAPAL